MSASDIWFHAYARGQLGPGLRSALAYDLIYKLFGAIVLGPLLAWLLGRLIRLSGTTTIANEAIASFVVSPVGLLFMLFTLAFTLLAFYTEQAGLIHIAGGANRGTATPWTNALTTALTAVPRLMHLALWQAGILLLWLLPLAAAAALAYKGLLGAHDINWYLAERPPELFIALIAGALLAALAAFVILRLLLDWALTIPICLYEQHCGRQALTLSRERMRGHRRRGLRLLVRSLLPVLLFTAGVAWLADVAIGVLLNTMSDIRALVVATAVAVLLLALLAILASFMLMAVYAMVVMHLYLELLGAERLPGERWRAAARQTRLPGLAVVLGLVMLLGGAGLLIDRQLNGLRLGRDVQITAHRGSSRYAPENTLSALYRAIEDGADMAEIDVQETADGTLVLLHDSDLMRVAGIPTKIWAVDYKDLRHVDVGSWFSPEFTNEPLTTLEEALMVAEGRIGLNIELKYNGHDQRLAERVVEQVREAECRHCIITSLSQQGLARVRELAPEIPIGQIVTAAVGDVTRLDVDLLSINQSRVSPGVVRANRAAGLATHVWTVNNIDDMSQMIDTGVDNIITDEPARLRTLLEERAELSDTELLLLALSRPLKD